MSIDPTALSAAERLLWCHGCRRPEHIDLEGIACERGARVVYRHLDGCAARLLTDGRQAVISIQASDSEGRRRFSLAHELAHWINDARRGFRCVGDDIGPQNAEAKSVEAAANDFSSQLILPDYLVTPWMRGRHVSLGLAVELAATFRTSVTAAAIKLARRTASAACLVCHAPQGRRWFVRSGAWPAGLYPRIRLHPDTPAFQLARQGAGPMARPATAPGSHWLGGQGWLGTSVEAQSMRLPDATVLTMLMLASGEGGRPPWRSLARVGRSPPAWVGGPAPASALSSPPPPRAPGPS